MTQKSVTDLEVVGVEEWGHIMTQLLLPMAVTAPDPETYRARIRAAVVGGIRFFTITSTPHSSGRSSRLFAEGGDPFYAVVNQIEGESRLRQLGRDSVLEAGDFAIYDTALPYDRDFADGTYMVIMVPQQLLTLPPRAFIEIAGMKVPADEGIGRVAGPMLAGVAKDMSVLLGHGGLALAHTVVDLIAAAVAERLGIDAPTRANAQLAQLMEVRDYIMAHLSDHDLTPQTIADAHFISVRTLHSLFKEQGTSVSTWIRERRLEMARRDLVDPALTDAIRAVGERWGFADATHFSNAFKLAYGVSPRQYRKTALDELRRSSIDRE
ncbi:helix-turn-helix domain-containing protein [Gulosibacter sediminis]|uniref:AraC-like ligand-binding domain-containing protein n=1 Tax=Gulosibacter sediminis TaxID=1729695 RepID=UPI0024A8B8AC|nr:helix-turn-helix domain-containing protein [Gulosibacter sediminis]